MSTASPPTEPAEPAPRPLTGGAVMAAASRGTVAVTGALTTIIIARVLGPEGSGTYFVAQSIVLLLMVAGTLGIEHGIAYYVSAGSWPARRAFASAMRMAALAGAVGVVVALLARLAFPSAFGGLSVELTAVVAAGLPFSLVWFYTTFVALATDRYEAYVLPPALQSLLGLVLAGGGALAFGIEGAVVGLTIAATTVGIGAAAWGVRRLPRAASADEPGLLRRAVKFGIKGYAANALQILNYRLDLFILSAAATTVAVGHYSVAVAVTSVLWLLPQALADVVFPRVAHLSAQGEAAEAHREMVEVKSVRHVVLAVVATTAVLALALLVLVVPVYGEDFRPAIELGLILLPGTALIGIAGVFSATIVGRGRPIYSLWIALMTTPLTIALYATLIPSLGATGAALASSLSYAGNFVLAAAFYRRVTGRRILPLLLPTSSEVDDLRALPRAIRTWLGARRA